MNREFIELPEFVTAWEKAGLSEENLSNLECYLCQNPEAGNLIQGTGGLRKLRWRIDNNGKRGGTRTLYVDFAFYEKIYLITIYTKNKKVSLTEKEKTELRILINLLKKELKKMSNYNSIVKGLQEAIEYEKGNLKVRTRVLEILPVDKFEKTDIKNIRKSLDLSQKTFSCLMGVSIKTIEAWESGENIPGGPAQRMLNLLRDDASIVDKFVRFK